MNTLLQYKIYKYYANLYTRYSGGIIEVTEKTLLVKHKEKVPRKRADVDWAMPQSSKFPVFEAFNHHLASHQVNMPWRGQNHPAGELDES